MLLQHEKSQLLDRLAVIDQRQTEVAQEKEEERRKEIARKEEADREGRAACQALEAIAKREGVSVEEIIEHYLKT